MIYVSGQYALGILIFDIIMLITVLLFRKSKGWKERLTLSPKDVKRVGYYAIGAGVFTLFLAHLGSYVNYPEYLEGLALDGFLFYMGLRMVTQGE
jgi:hypothetical protein